MSGLKKPKKKDPEADTDTGTFSGFASLRCSTAQFFDELRAQLAKYSEPGARTDA